MDETTKQALFNDIKKTVQSVEYDVNKRNKHINTRYQAIYEDGLYRDLEIENWFAEYNLVARVVDIMTTQLFGRGVNIISDYSKEDLSAYDNNPQEKEAMRLRNKKLKADADARQKIALAILEDNGGTALLEDGGRIGSAFGTTAYKQYLDKANKRVVLSNIESVQNLRVGWADDNFREHDWVAYVYQMSIDRAKRLYQGKLPEGVDFDFTKQGMPLGNNFGNSNTSDPLDQKANTKAPETQRDMVTVIDFTGYLPGWGAKDGKIVKVKPGEESEISVFSVGGHPVELIADQKYIPKYYIIDNRYVPLRAWGESDITDTLIDINKEIIRLMADEMTWVDTNLWKILMGKGMTEDGLTALKNKRRKTKVIAMSQEQDIQEVTISGQSMSEFARLIEQKLDMFVRLAGVGRVLFDDPTINANSNQALMTTLKGMVDIIESKQKRWTPKLKQMFTDGLNMTAEIDPKLKAIMTDDQGWKVDIEWPSVLRREDATYQTMLLNQLNAKAMSLDTYLQKAVGINAQEEIDRLRDNYADPMIAGILGGQTALLASQIIAPPQPASDKPEVKYNVSVKADATLDPNANAEIINKVAPESQQETQAEGGQEEAPMPQGDPQTNPTLTADQNTGQTASQPGSGATAVSPEGAIAQANQRRGQ